MPSNPSISWTILVADDYDLEQRRFLVTGLDNDYRAPRFREEADPKEFSPNALLYYVR